MLAAEVPDDYHFFEALLHAIALSHRPPRAVKTETRMKRPLEHVTRRGDAHPETISIYHLAGSGKVPGILAAAPLIVEFRGAISLLLTRTNAGRRFYASDDRQPASRTAGIPRQPTFKVQYLISDSSRSPLKVPRPRGPKTEFRGRCHRFSEREERGIKGTPHRYQRV